MSEAKTTSFLAVLKFLKGPEKGRTFELREDLVHFGRGPESDCRLKAKDLQDYELSIVLRNERYAIYAARGGMVTVEGNLLPGEKWVWLPEEALIKIGEETELEFRVQNPSGTKASKSKTASAKEGKPLQVKGMPAPAKMKKTPASEASGSKESPKEKKSKSATARQRNVAKFITDQVGDPLVQLGEDGHLPELHLAEIEGGGKEKKSSEKKQSSGGNPLLLGVVLGLSLISSVLLMVMAPEPGGRSSVDQSTARIEIRQFYGGEDDELEDYQILLREAALAHSRGETGEEKDYYRRVLKMLISEDNQGLIRLTDSREQDQKLRDLLSILLAN
ncbi:MAG: hypothetical protein HUJ26_12360 [Planctomycetaceae bacterium]|nr:hypothetical protein [Planctomycetaceae bacterium]